MATSLLLVGLYQKTPFICKQFACFPNMVSKNSLDCINFQIVFSLEKNDILRKNSIRNNFVLFNILLYHLPLTVSRRCVLWTTRRVGSTSGCPRVSRGRTGSCQSSLGTQAPFAVWPSWRSLAWCSPAATTPALGTWVSLTACRAVGDIVRVLPLLSIGFQK